MFDNANTGLCVICNTPVDIKGKITCSKKCHEEFIKFAEKEFGVTKNVTCNETGKTYQVPTRDIIEKGLKWEELTKYPLSEDNEKIKESEKYVVDNVFSKVGSVFMVPEGEDPQVLLSQFDHPEKLVIVEGPYGRSIQHRDHLPHLEKRAKIVMQMLKERNMTTNDVAKLSFDDILKMRKEIEKRMKNE